MYKCFQHSHIGAYRMISKQLSKNQYIDVIFQAIHKNKREKALEINELAKKGGGESYIDSSRGIAVGMGM